MANSFWDMAMLWPSRVAVWWMKSMNTAPMRRFMVIPEPAALSLAMLAVHAVTCVLRLRHRVWKVAASRSVR